MKGTFLLLLCIVFFPNIAAAEMNPQAYYELEIQARELTLEGLKKRLACIRSNCELPAQYAIDEEYQQKIMTLHEKAGTTPSRLAAWYTNHAAETENYRLVNPQLQMQLDTLSGSFEEHSDEIKKLMEIQQ